MATSKHGSWTILFIGQSIVKRSGEFDIDTARGYQCGGTDFWMQPKFSNLSAIQFTDDNTDNDQVEYRDSSPNGSYDSSVLGDFRQFIDTWDSAHLAVIQANWDAETIPHLEGNGKDLNGKDLPETEEQKITRIGSRPTTYSSH